MTDKVKSIDINVQTGEETVVYFTEEEWAALTSDENYVGEITPTPASEG